MTYRNDFERRPLWMAETPQPAMACQLAHGCGCATEWERAGCNHYQPTPPAPAGVAACPRCDGEGYRSATQVCRTCDGAGLVPDGEIASAFGNAPIKCVKDCPACGGPRRWRVGPGCRDVLQRRRWDSESEG